MSEPELSPGYIQAVMRGLGVERGARIAVAVSGGADSVALALLLASGFDVAALTVDHGLRTASDHEANVVQRQMQTHGIRHQTLRWQHEGAAPASNIQAQARAARYDLMANWCSREGISYLITAHHRDDQAETLLLRLARGSGVYGLAAMDAVRRLTPHVTLVRPLLDVGKHQLKEFLTRQNITWIDDPSNESEAFERVKARKLLATEPLQGLNFTRIADTAKRLGRTRDAMRYYEDMWLTGAVCFHDAGYAELKQSALDDAPVEIILRGLSSILRFAGGKNYGPRFEKLERLLQDLKDSNFNGATLGGVKFNKSNDGVITIVREISLAAAPEIVAGRMLWDERYDIDGTKNGERSDNPIYIGLLGQLPDRDYSIGLREYFASRDGVLPARDILEILPVFFDTERLIAVPHLGYNPANSDIPVLTHRWLSLSKS